MICQKKQCGFQGKLPSPLKLPKSPQCRKTPLWSNSFVIDTFPPCSLYLSVSSYIHNNRISQKRVLGALPICLHGRWKKTILMLCLNFTFTSHVKNIKRKLPLRSWTSAWKCNLYLQRRSCHYLLNSIELQSLGPQPGSGKCFSRHVHFLFYICDESS